MTSSVRQNATNAGLGQRKGQETEASIMRGDEVARQLLSAMNDVSAASRKIGDIIDTVNEVAFQTNLLALNAAVEAARAGEHGKGFAVVAEEVRALAQRSANAASQVRKMIEDTVMKIQAGDSMVRKTAESFVEIRSQIETLSQTIDEISAATSEQSSGIEEVNRAIGQIDTTTQSNAGTVEELSSAADSLAVEASSLARTVERFKVSAVKIEAGFDRRQPAAKKPSERPRLKAVSVKPDVSKPASAKRDDFAPEGDDGFEEF
ncbi:MAG: Methyl-accepting chemotaxis protein II [Deltaproteobacteria bacterium ADurb.Bin510]|nr:MAG: Methyl-accepting chemotaxis protein II [Deltaproteobacteria bacterium ADurb.Bin510]